MNAKEILEYLQSAPHHTVKKTYHRNGVDVVTEPSMPESYVEWACFRSKVPLLKEFPPDCRIEYGALIREHVTLHSRCIVMMGAIINIGASIGAETMVDMGAVIGGNVQIGNRCHIGANAVLAGTIEPYSAVPVILEDDVFIGANATVLEGIRIGARAIVGAGAVVTKAVPADAIVIGVPARIKGYRKAKQETVTIQDKLR